MTDHDGFDGDVVAGRSGDILVVLAGGRSRRFGSDKALAGFGQGEEPLALRTLRRLEQLGRKRVLVRATPLPGLPRDVLRVSDPRPGDGPLQALDAAFEAVPARRWFVAPCDLPGLDAAVYERLARVMESVAASVVAARAPDGLEPLVSIWSADAGAALARWLADEPQLAVHAALARLGAAEVEFSDPRPFLNANTPEELAQAASLEGVRT